ncbi:hypothetical protein C1H46_020284 [Malus baccata]|uniref:Uncharacterized protein n=1 Tax=Malus baccata TaxID=106549 RepID=A0A540M6F7_MALBA|nr:hypothetical protein C1H46_020284 [Malus baccata]
MGLSPMDQIDALSLILDKQKKCGSVQGNQTGTQESVCPKAFKRQSKRMSILCGAF